MAKPPLKTEEDLIYEAIVEERARRMNLKMMQEVEQDEGAVREKCTTLLGFVQQGWRILEPATELKIGWAIEAMAEHYEAISYRHIKNLLINCPPGLMKSLLQNVFFPAWEWGPRGLDYHRYVCTSYGLPLTNRDGSKFLRLITSPWYQKLWPKIVLERTAVDNLENTGTGTRVGVPWSKSMGKRGTRFMFDDPHDLENAESDEQRANTVRLWQEGATSRLNDPELDSFLGVMQRLHEADVSGWILENDKSFTHLMLPQEFDPDRRCITYRKDKTVLFKDPRKEDGELLFPERYNRAYVDTRRKLIGEYAFAGQDQQLPRPRGGGLFQRSWFDERKVKKITDLPAPIVRTVRGWDLAATDIKALKTSGARTAGVKIGKLANDEGYVILHCVSRGVGPKKVHGLLKSTAVSDGRGVEISAPQDPAAAGKVQKAAIIKLLAGYITSVTPETGDKATRFTPFSIQCEEGNVWILEGPWNKEFFDELEKFPNGNRKDIADAASRAFGHLLTKKQRNSGHGLAAPIVLRPDEETEEA